MTQYATRGAILARLALAERDEESPPLGGALRLIELTRAQMRDAGAFATTTNLADRERARGVLLAGAVAEADGDADALRRALTAYYLGAPESATDATRWNAALFAAGVIDPETKAPLFTRDEILSWPERALLWNEVLRIAQAVLDLSGVGSESLKSGDPAPDAE